MAGSVRGSCSVELVSIVRSGAEVCLWATCGYGPSAIARAEILPLDLRLYMQAGASYRIDPWILAGIGAVETNHGRSTAPGVRAGVNSFGCCAGPRQFSVAGNPSTWDRFGVDGDHDGRLSPYEPADAIPAAARHLRAHRADAPTLAPA